QGFSHSCPGAVIVESYRPVRDLYPELGSRTWFFHQGNRPAMGKNKLARDGEAETGAAGARRTTEGGKQVFPGFARHARTGIVDDDPHDAADPLGGDRDTANRGRIVRVEIGECLHGIPADIVDDAEELIAVGV